MATVWDPKRLLAIINPDTAAQTCVGNATSKNRRCTYAIAARSRSAIASELSHLARQQPRDIDSSALENLAIMCLCLKYHRDQVPSVVAKWKRAIRREQARLDLQQLASTPVASASSSRASASPATSTPAFVGTSHANTTRPAQAPARSASSRLVAVRPTPVPSVAAPGLATVRVTPSPAAPRVISDAQTTTVTSSTITPAPQTTTPTSRSVTAALQVTTPSSTARLSASPSPHGAADTAATLALPAPAQANRELTGSEVPATPPSTVNDTPLAAPTAPGRNTTRREDTTLNHNVKPLACTQQHVGRRSIDAECPVCLDNMAAASLIDLLWCKKHCGQNVHADCWRKWMYHHPDPAKCVACRGDWDFSCEHDLAMPPVAYEIWKDDEGETGVARLFDLRAHLAESLAAWL